MAADLVVMWLPHHYERCVDEYERVFVNSEREKVSLLTFSTEEIITVFGCSEACAIYAKRKEEAEERRREAAEQRVKEEAAAVERERIREHQLKLATLNADAAKQSNIDRFYKALREKYNTRQPNADTMRRIFKHFSARFIAVTGKDGMEEECHDLYMAARNLPGTTTKGHIKGALGISVNGPVDESYPHILSALSADGKPLAVKLLKLSDVTHSCSQEDRNQALQAEIAACEAITQKKLNGLVHYEYKMVMITNNEQLNVGPGEWRGLVAPRFVESLAKAPEFTEEALERGYARMMEALRLLHSETNLVHLDVKADNVFIDADGLWFLGDFGSCRAPDQPIFSVSHQWNPYTMIKGVTLAHKSMDFVQLCIMIATLLCKDTLTDLLSAEEVVDENPIRRVDAEAVIRKLSLIEMEDFREKIMKDFRQHMDLVKDHFGKTDAQTAAQ